MIKLIDKIRRAIIQFKMVSIRNGWKKAEFLKKKNIFHHIGEHSFYQSTYLPAEPFLVSIGNNVAISAGVRLITHSAAHVIFDKEDNTNEYICRHGKVEIGNNVYIGADVIINMGITIGNNVAISAGVRLITHSAAHVIFDKEDNTNEYICRHGKVEIGNNVYIGADVIINMGITIGNNVIIAAGAIVTHDIPDNSVVAGVPAKIIGTYTDTKKKHKEYSKKYNEAGLYEPCTVREMTEKFPIEFND